MRLRIGWTSAAPRPLRIAKKYSNRYLVGEHHVAGLAHLDYPLLKRMFQHARQRAQQTGQEEVPVVFTNDTKDVSNFRNIERFVRDLSKRHNGVQPMAHRLRRYCVRESSRCAPRQGETLSQIPQDIPSEPLLPASATKSEAR